MKKLIKHIEFTITDVEILDNIHYGVSTFGHDQEILRFMKDKGAEIRGTAKLYQPKNSEMVWWYDPEHKCTHYQQRLFEEE